MFAWIKLGVLGDDWYTSEEWQEVRLSSKNHVDLPIIIPTGKIPITLQQYQNPKNEYGSRYTWVIPFISIWVPIFYNISTGNGQEEVVHLLMSHPTPPAFDSGKNQAQNGAEVQFWHDYIQGTVFQKAVLEFTPYVMNSRLKLLHWVLWPGEITGKMRFLQKGTNSRTALWKTVIQGKEYFYDDLGNKGGLTVGSKFIMMGDQNLDPIAGKL